MKTKKITKATIKSFIKKNIDNLFVNIESNFDGMVDCVMPCSNGFAKIQKSKDINNKNTMGIPGVWFVDSSRNYFLSYENKNFLGFECANSCGNWIIAIEK